ncbi:MAG TPA: hypothetical protein VEL76_10855 [Gemmataceae bacterium]|nr:hypothetical protein [Gemmataceae bacterium]
MTTPTHFTTGRLAAELGVAAWQLRRVIDALGLPVPRAGLYRLFPADRIDELKAELRRRGYLPEQEVSHAG